jgi:8-oxo-dGTP diphosphatase
VNVYVLRHAKAGSRSRWDGPDELRPLSKAGRRQAREIAQQLGDAGITRILSSPYVRCRESVEPLGKRIGVVTELNDAIAEGKPLREALRLVEKVSDQPTLLCTHGDIVADVLSHCERHGVHIGDWRLEKGSTWVLTIEHGSIVAAAHLPPPA